MSARETIILIFLLSVSSSGVHYPFDDICGRGLKPSLRAGANGRLTVGHF